MTAAERRQQAEDLGLEGHDAESFIAFHAKEDAGTAPAAGVAREVEPPPMTTVERAPHRSAPTTGPARASASPPASQSAPPPSPPPMMATPVTHHAIRPAPVDPYATSSVGVPMLDVPDFPVSDNSDPPSVAYRVGRGMARIADIPVAYGRLQSRVGSDVMPGVLAHEQASLRASNAAGMEMVQRAGQAPTEAARRAGQAVAPVVADVARGYGSVRPTAPKPPDYGTSDPGEPAPRQPVVVVRPVAYNPRPAATVAAPASNPALDDAIDFLVSQGAIGEADARQAAATPEGQQLLIRRAVKYKAYLGTQAAQ